MNAPSRSSSDSFAFKISNSFFFQNSDYYFTLCEFFTPTLADCLLLKPKREQVSTGLMTLLNILVDLNNAAVWMVTINPPIFNSSIPLTKSLGIIPSATITIGITVTFMFHSLSSLARSKYLCLFSLSLLGWQSPLYSTFSFSFSFSFSFFLFFCQLCHGMVFWLVLGDLFVHQNLRILCV